MVIDRREIEELAQNRDGWSPVVSLYLNVTPPRNFTTELKSLISTTTEEVKEKEEFNKEQFRELDGIFDSLASRVQNTGHLEGARLLVIFASSNGLWKEYRVPIALPSQMVVEPAPYVRPLTMLLDKFERHCVLVIDGSKARIFSLYLKEFEEYPDVFIQSEVPSRVRVKSSMTGSMASGIRGGLGEQRIQRHIQDHIHRHLKYVAERTLDFFKKKSFDRLIIAAPEDKILPWLKDHLHSYLRDRLVGEFNANPGSSEQNLKEKALEVAQEFELGREKELIEKVFEQKGPKGKAVLGIEPTLEALMLGQVHTLVIQSVFKASGFVCSRDRILSTYLEKCPLCEQPMERTEDLAEEMVEEVILQSGEVEYIFEEHENFQKHGVGALLRFTL